MKKILKSLTIYISYLKVICLNPGIQNKISLEGLKKGIISYNIEKQIYFNDAKREDKDLKMAYTRKPIEISEIYGKRGLGEVGEREGWVVK